MDQIPLLVYLVMEEYISLNNRKLNKLTRLDAIVYGTQLTGEVYRAGNDVFWIVVIKITIGGPAWAYTRSF